LVAAVLVMVLVLATSDRGAVAGGLADTIGLVKPSVVAVGTYQRTRKPAADLLGTGFVVGDGLHVVTSGHVIPRALDDTHRETLSVFLPGGETVEARPAELVAEDPEHDLAVLRISDTPLPALSLGDDETAREGQSVAFTGFPAAPALGLYPVTHRGIISAVTPVAVPPPSAGYLNHRMIQRLRENYTVFQLDATAYPGNSGSPLFDPATGAVIGVVGSVGIKETKERVLQDPSGITYAIPIRYVKELLTALGQ
jgi:S1-C subfamily serine protease